MECDWCEYLPLDEGRDELAMINFGWRQRRRHRTAFSQLRSCDCWRPLNIDHMSMSCVYYASTSRKLEPNQAFLCKNIHTIEFHLISFSWSISLFNIVICISLQDTTEYRIIAKHDSESLFDGLND